MNEYLLIENNKVSECLNKNITEIQIPEGCTEISDDAFSDCRSLKHVKIPNGVISIGWCSFRNCTSLESINIPNSVRYISLGAFSGCKSLKDINIPLNIDQIYDGAFSGCDSLPIEDGFRCAGPYLVEVVDKTRDTYEISSRIKFIGTSAFKECVFLEKIEIPTNVKSIGNFAFKGCTSLKYVKLHDSLKSIGDAAFQDCISLQNISIPKSISLIIHKTFSGCVSLPVIDGVRYADSFLVEVIDKTRTEYVIRNGTRIIGFESFKNCINLESIDIPKSVTHIMNNSFEGCISLDRVILHNGIESILHSAFKGCTKISSIKIPRTLLYIGENAFVDCHRISFVIAPNRSLYNRDVFAPETKVLFSGRIPIAVKSIDYFTYRTVAVFNHSNGNYEDTIYELLDTECRIVTYFTLLTKEERKYIDGLQETTQNQNKFIQDRCAYIVKSGGRDHIAKGHEYISSDRTMELVLKLNKKFPNRFFEASKEIFNIGKYRFMSYHINQKVSEKVRFDEHEFA